MNARQNWTAQNFDRLRTFLNTNIFYAKPNNLNTEMKENQNQENDDGKR